MAKRMLADVLWEAANERLWDGRSRDLLSRQEYSCHAMEMAERGHYFNEGTPGVLFLRDLGVAFDFTDVPAWRWLDGLAAKDHQRQGVRYMWLLLAMHVAEDEGLEIEVSA